MALALTVTNHWDDGKRLHVVAGLTPSGNYAAGGDAIPLTSTDIKSRKAPIMAIPMGTGSAVYDYLVTINANVLVLKIVTRSTGTELAAGAYPAGILADLIGVYMIFHKFVG